MWSEFPRTANGVFASSSPSTYLVTLLTSWVNLFINIAHVINVNCLVFSFFISSTTWTGPCCLWFFHIFKRTSKLKRCLNNYLEIKIIGLRCDFLVYWKLRQFVMEIVVHLSPSALSSDPQQLSINSQSVRLSWRHTQ